MKKKLNFFPLLIMFIFFSCQKEVDVKGENPDFNESAALNTALISCNQPDSIELAISYAIGSFFDEMAEDGLDTFNTRHAIMQDYLISNSLDTVTIDEAVSLYIRFHNMDSVIVQNYFQAIVEYKELLLAQANRECIVAGLYNYVEEANSLADGQIELRFIFSTLAQILGAHCGLMAAGGIVDAALEAAAAVALSPTGVGLTIGLVSAAGSFASAVATALNCN